MKLLALATTTLTTTTLASGWCSGPDGGCSTTHRVEAPACEGEACTKVAATVAWTLDTTVDPCDDFFAFACRASGRGHLPSSEPPLVELSWLVTHPPLGFHYIRDFYTSCTALTSFLPTEEVLVYCMRDGSCTLEELATYGPIFPQLFGYVQGILAQALFPAITPAWEEETSAANGGEGWNWWNFAAEALRNSYFFGAFHYIRGNIGGGTDHFRPHLFFVPFIEETVDRGRAGDGDLLPRIHVVPMRVPRRIREKDLVWIAKYKGLMTMAIKALGGQQELPDLARDVDRIVEWEIKIGELTPHEYSPDTSWVTVTVKELYDLDPHTDWMDYLQATLTNQHTEELGCRGIRVRRNTKVTIPSKEIIAAMGKLVKEMEADRRQQANLLIWRMFINFANDFLHTGTTDGSNLSDDIFATIGGQGGRSHNCLTQVQTFFPTAQHDMLVAHYVTEEQKDVIRNSYFTKLKKSFHKIIEESSWMSNRTKKRAQRKLAGMKISIGETTPQTAAYEELKSRINSTNYLGNVLAIGNYRWATQIAEFFEEKKLFDNNEDDNNAFYSAHFNTIIIKTGLIAGFLGQGFSLQLPPALVFGGFVASTLGHELTHGFDSKGRHYDRNGNRMDWWGEGDGAQFEERAECLRQQYANFTIEHQGTTYSLPRQADQRENIADSGAARAAYRAFLDLLEEEGPTTSLPGVDLTPDQLFWVGWALDWCTMGDQYTSIPTYPDLLSLPVDSSGHFPSPWRVDLPLANMQEFAAAFHCSRGDRMVPETPCRLW